MTSSASNHVSGSSSSTSWGAPWDDSYDQTVSYPGFSEARYYGRDYGGGSGEEDYFASLGDAFTDGSSSGFTGTMFPFAYGDEELLFGQGARQWRAASDAGRDGGRSRSAALC